MFMLLLAQKYLDNSDAARKFGLLDKLCIIFLPPNITSRIQPTYMGIISVLKVRYKFFMIIRLLAVYEDQSFTDIDTARKRQKMGCKGMAFVTSPFLFNTNTLARPQLFPQKCSERFYTFLAKIKQLSRVG